MHYLNFTIDLLSDVKLQKICFILMILTLPFTVIPVDFPLLRDGLPIFFFWIGSILFVFRFFMINHQFTFFENIMFKFLIILFSWAVISSVLGVLFYVYYSNIDLLQMENFKNFYDNFLLPFLGITDLSAIKFWLSYKAIRYAFFYVLFSFFVSFWIYTLYSRHWQQGIYHLKKALSFICIILISYSVIEVGYLCGSDLCKNILMVVNPLYMKIGTSHGWWPPLLWDQLQLRSMFPEPSFFGIFAAMAIPFFVYDFYEKKISKKYFYKKIIFTIFIYASLTIMIVLSKSRTGLLLYIGEIILIILWSFRYRLFQWKRTVLLIVCTGIAFLVGLVLVSQFKSSNHPVISSTQSINVESYVNDNVKSAIGNSRSNNARRASVLATFRTGMDNPWLGVGINMRHEDVAAHFTDEEKKVGEVSLWIRYMSEKGPLKSGVPNLNQFSVVFAEQGVIGLLLYLLPLGYIIFLVIRNRHILREPRIACLCTAFIGLAIALFANEAKIEFYIIMGLLFSVLLDYDGKDEMNNG